MVPIMKNRPGIAPAGLQLEEVMPNHRSLLLRIVVVWGGKVKLDLTLHIFTAIPR